jgi:5-methylcytosine-specific restriction endonuclease McrBC GTP-binding regulatory subunit McrB
MGIDFVVYNEVSGKTVFCESVKWLRDSAPRELFYGNNHTMKEVMTTDDLRLYFQDIKRYTNALQFQKADPNDEDDWDKWVSKDREHSIEDWLWQKLVSFQNILKQAIELGLVARWSI